MERREHPTNGTSGTCEKPTDHAKDKPMQNGVDGLVDGSSIIIITSASPTQPTQMEAAEINKEQSGSKTARR